MILVISIIYLSAYQTFFVAKNIRVSISRVLTTKFIFKILYLDVIDNIVPWYMYICRRNKNKYVILYDTELFVLTILSQFMRKKSFYSIPNNTAMQIRLCIPRNRISAINLSFVDGKILYTRVFHYDPKFIARLCS